MNLKEFLEPKGFSVMQQVNFGNELLEEQFGTFGAMEATGTIQGTKFKMYDFICVFQVNNEILVYINLENETIKYTDIFKEVRSQKDKKNFKKLMIEFSELSNFKLVN